MNIWNIKHGEIEHVLHVGECTVLCGSNVFWYEIIREINDYFNSRVSIVEMEEGGLNIIKKDWDCYLIPYNSDLNFDKINSKSPLVKILDSTIEQLQLSPIYNEFQHAWSGLQEEMLFVSEKTEIYDLEVKLHGFDNKELKKFLYLKSFQQHFGPSECKLLNLKLINELNVEKKLVILIELPELFSSIGNLEEINRKIKEMIAKGAIVIVLTNDTQFCGIRNYALHGKVINEYRFKLIKSILIKDAPFIFDDAEFNEAKSECLKIVDNYLNYNEKLKCNSNKEKINILIFMMFKNLGIQVNIDIEGFPGNIKRFVNGYVIER